MSKQYHRNVQRGEVYLADITTYDIRTGSEQRGKRPVVIIQNDVGNTYSPTTIVAMITAEEKPDLPTHLDIKLLLPSTIMCEQIATIDKNKLAKRITRLTGKQMKELDEKIKISVGLKEEFS